MSSSSSSSSLSSSSFSLFCFTACLVLFSPSLPTLHSPGEVPFTKQKIASQRCKNHLPEALLELFQPIKNKPFLKDWHEYRIYANLGEKELCVCELDNHSSVVTEYKSKGNGRDILAPTADIFPQCSACSTEQSASVSFRWSQE